MSPPVQPKTQAILAQVEGKQSTLTLSLSYSQSFQLLNIGLVPSISNRGSITFMDHNNANTIYQAGVLRTIASLQVSNNLLLGIGVSLVLSSFQSCLILALATISSSQGFKTATILPLEVFTDPIAALPAAVFLSIVIEVLGNFQCLFICQGFQSIYVLFLGFTLYLCSFSSILFLQSQ